MHQHRKEGAVWQKIEYMLGAFFVIMGIFSSLSHTISLFPEGVFAGREEMLMLIPVVIAVIASLVFVGIVMLLLKEPPAQLPVPPDHHIPQPVDVLTQRRLDKADAEKMYIRNSLFC